MAAPKKKAPVKIVKFDAITRIALTAYIADTSTRIEVYSATNGWKEAHPESILGYASNGLKLRIMSVPPCINWAHINPLFKFLTAEEDGESVILWEKKPKYTEGGGWVHDTPARENDGVMESIMFSSVEEDGEGEEVEVIRCFYSSFKPGTCDDCDSLVVRPGYKPLSDIK